tara:strand:+ start:179 stop:430 length:252 start_codon:yes stop_codon:yes gene_type:complete
MDSPTCSCRGGVGSDSDDPNDYVLEIGQMQHCDTSMLALAAHIDEVRALFATLKDNPLAALVEKSWGGLEYKLNKQLKESKGK